MPMRGFGELMIFMVIVLVIFGTSRVASAGKHLVMAIREFKGGPPWNQGGGQAVVTWLRWFTKMRGRR